MRLSRLNSYYLMLQKNSAPLRKTTVSISKRVDLCSISGPIAVLTLSFLALATPLFPQEPEKTPQEQPADETAPAGEATEGTGDTTTDTTGEGTPTPTADEPRENLGNGFANRFRFLLGFGRATFTPAILREAGPSWQLNSFLISAVDANTSPVVQLSEPGSLRSWPLYAEGEWTYNDRLTVGLRYYGMNQSFSRDAPATVDFFHPAGATKRWSYFEGVRLAKYKEQHHTLDVQYLYPVWLRGLKAGVYFAREWYFERDEVSFGSYVATNLSDTVAPGTLNWSQGAVTPVDVRAKGLVFGPALRYQIFDWLGVNYKLTLVNRQGTLSYFGVRTIQQSDEVNGTFNVSALIPSAFAEFSETGIRHNLETVFQFYCRYSVHLGVLKEDIDRSYSTYFSGTLPLNPTIPFQQKTPTGLGIGETSQSFKSDKLEIYMKFGVAFFL